MTAPDPVFNEPSASPLANDAAEARTRMRGVIDILLLAPTRGLGRSLRISKDFYLLPLAADYTINSWLQDPAVDRDRFRFFLGLAAKAPYLRQQDGDAFERIGDSEAVCHGVTHEAFLAAHALDSFLVSFDQGVWSPPELPASVTQMDGEGELFTEAAILRNLACPHHYDHHSGWFASRDAVRSPADLWYRRSELFPNLIFCPSVEEQLMREAPLLTLIAKRLADVQRVAALQNPFSATAFHSTCRPTSAATLDQFRNHYEFRAPDGGLACCGWHLILPDGRRIYFAPGNPAYTIGHIGGHLPTVKYH